MNATFDQRRVDRELGRKRWNEKVLLELVRMGDPLFEYLALGIKGQTWAGRETANALFLLGNLVREFCPRRKPEALELALGSMDDGRQEVRDSAVRLTILLSMLAQRFPQLGIKRTRSEVQHRVARALEAGLGAEAKEYAEHFLRSV